MSDTEILIHDRYWLMRCPLLGDWMRIKGSAGHIFFSDALKLDATLYFPCDHCGSHPVEEVSEDDYHALDALADPPPPDVHHSREYP